MEQYTLQSCAGPTSGTSELASRYTSDTNDPEWLIYCWAEDESASASGANLGGSALMKQERYLLDTRRDHYSLASASLARTGHSLHITEEQDKLHVFIQRLVYLFEQQRSIGQYQFTVLFLSPLPFKDISITNTVFQTQMGVVSTPAEATDRSHPLFPMEDNFCNYMTARPHGRRHAEVRLMKRWERLLCTYESLGRPSCRSIVIYTWLLPCMQCTEAIAESFLPYIMAGQYEVTVVYTCKQRDLTDEAVAKIQSCFELSGIEVCYVPFDQRLRRGSSL